MDQQQMNESPQILPRAMKRRRSPEVNVGANVKRLQQEQEQEQQILVVCTVQATQELNVNQLLMAKKWNEATARMNSHPHEVTNSKPHSPLALACRLGAPYDCVKTTLRLCPSKLRHLLDSRGTPLHEAIVCEDAGPQLIRLLLDADEALGTDTPRAAVLQDVDGYVPLHLLIRRRFQQYVLDHQDGADSEFMQILEMLVKSCKEALIVPHRGEYEEPPIVMALKAQIYAPLPQSEDESMERKMHQMLQCMLRYYPQAASCVFNGYRGQYTALHSAVFHGRCPESLGLLLAAEARCPAPQKATLLANTQGEMPLHFCTMRGEPPRSVALLAEATPEAVLVRDASGLTPMHWLWIRFVSSLLALDDGGRGTSETMRLETRTFGADLTDYTGFTSLQQDDFEANLHLIRRLDPPVDFLRMRHIPDEVLGEADSTHWAERTIEILQRVRERFRTHRETANEQQGDQVIEWTRVEVVSSLFWTKVVALLRSAWVASGDSGKEEFSVVKMAFAAPCCPPPIARIITTLFPDEMATPDCNGRLPLHHACMRAWHAWDCPREDGTSDSSNARLLARESMSILNTAMSMSPRHAASHADKSKRLPLHHAIPTLVAASCSVGRSCSEHPVYGILETIKTFVNLNPDGIQLPDPTTGLLPCLQASAEAIKYRSAQSDGNFTLPVPDEPCLSIVYSLLREDPSICGC